MNEKLPQLMGKYAKQGITKGKLILLRPNDALQFVDELETIGVPILGIELWYYVKLEDKDVIAENPVGPDFSDLLSQENAVQKSVALAKDYIGRNLPEKTAFVSFVLDDPYY